MNNNWKSTKSLSAGGISLLLLIIIVIIISSNTKKKELTESPTVKTIIAKQAQAITSIEVAGFVKGENRADVAPMASGRILQILKKEGMTVRKGETLATIEATGADAQLTAADAGVAAMKKTLNETESYYDQLVSQAEAMPSSKANDEAISSAKRARDLQIQATKDQLVAAQGSADVAKAGKGNFILTAPFDGIITAIYSRVGGFASIGNPLLNISTTNNFEVEAYASATNGRKIAIGNIVTFKSNSNAPLTGIVTAVAAGADTQNLKTLVRIHLNDTKNEIYLGDFLHGEILIPTNEKTISIPRNSIISRGGDLVVFTIDENDVAKEQNVKIGNENNGFANINEGLSENQKVVIEGQQYLINGLTTKTYATN
jgi:RND family efflux transporter MFP subunit